MRTLWLIYFVLLFSCAMPARAKQTPEDRSNPAISGELSLIDPDTGRARSLLKADGESLGRPVVVGGTLYVASSGHTLHALDAKTGETKWQFASPAPIYGVAATDKGVFVGAAGTLDALDPANGKVLWKYESDIAIVDPVLVDGMIIFNALDGPVALEQAGGKLRWRLAMQWGYFVFSPLSEGRLCVWKPDEIFVVETERGKTLWQSAADQSVSAPGALPSAAVAWGDVICQLQGTVKDAEDWSLTAREAGSGRPVWKTALGQHEATGARTLIAGKSVYSVLEDHLAAVDLADGKLKWQATVKPLEAGGTGPLAGHGLLYVPELGGDIAALDEKTGKPKWTNPAPNASPKTQIRIGGLCISESGLYVTRNEQMRQ